MHEIFVMTAIFIAVSSAASILLMLSENITYFRYDLTELSSIKIEKNTLQLDILDYFNAEP